MAKACDMFSEVRVSTADHDFITLNAKLSRQILVHGNLPHIFHHFSKAWILRA